jgi:hypothetical protein
MQGHKHCEKELAQAIERCSEASNDIRAALSITARIDFGILDRSVASKGDEVLGSLREAFEHMHLLTTWWIKSAIEGVGIAKQADRPWASNPNLIAVKTLVVSLRALSEKACGLKVDTRHAMDLACLLEQGVMEQLLSWSSEATTCYTVLHQAFRVVPTFVNRTPASRPKGHGLVARRRQSMLMEKLACRMETESTACATDGHDDCQPVFRASTQRLRCAAVTAESDARNKRARMQTFRPPRLVIPETSWDFKARKL